jgi:hypothetical protein
MGGEDGFGLGCPCEGLGVLVAMLNPFVDRVFKFRYIMENASSDALARDLGEEPLDEVEPGAGCWREVELETLVPGEPALHLLCLVGGVIVDDEMQIEADGSLAVDLPEERQEFVCPVAGQAFADDPAGRHIERGEERRRAIALVVMGHRPGAALFQGQAGLRPVERLNLAFLVDGQHERLLRRIEIEADDVLNLFEEIGVVGDLEALHLMRLEPVLGPDPLHARVADSPRPSSARSSAWRWPDAPSRSSRRF